MKIYVAGHNQGESKIVASKLKDAGHEITSTWLEEDFKRTVEHTEAERRQIAIKDAEEVVSSEALVLLASPYRVPGGKFVEAGIAIGKGLPVHILGHRENMLMWHPSTRQHNSVEDLVKKLAEDANK